MVERYSIPRPDPCPKAVVVLCGKRKTGKDYVAALLVEMLGKDLVCPVRLSAPIKQQYAKDHELDLEQLMDSSSYKETHRETMITWSQAIRAEDPAYFCQLAVAEAEPQKVWLVVDARRETDMHFFKTHYGDCIGVAGGGRSVLTVRVEASQEVRQSRGWTFSPNIDDAPSECDLDHYTCDVIIENNCGNQQQLRQKLEVVTEWVREK